MALSTVSLTINNYPQGIDNTQRRTVAYGTAAVGASALTYTAGGIRINWAANQLERVKVVTLLPALAEFRTKSGSGYVYVWNPLGAKITNVALTSNVVTITAANNLAVGDVVSISGVTTATFLNGQNLTVATAAAGSFTAAFTHADYSTAADTGFALPTSYVSGLPFLGNLQVFQSAGSAAALAEIGTAAVPAGVSGDNIIFKAEFLREL